MPRGVYTRKKAAPKRAAKKAPTTTRRRRAPRGEVVEIPTISRSQLRSSVSDVRTPDTPQTLRSEIAPVAAEAVAPASEQLPEDMVKFAVFDNDGNDDSIDWGDMQDAYSTYEQAEEAARHDVGKEGSTSMFIVQVIANIQRSGVVVKRTGPRL